jgi:hypothetical protein
VRDAHARGAHAGEHSGETRHAQTARAYSDTPEAVPSSLHQGALDSNAGGGEDFVPGVENLPREAGPELLRRLSGQNSSSPATSQKNAGAARHLTGAQRSTPPPTRADAQTWPPPGRAQALLQQDGASRGSQPRGHRADPVGAGVQQGRGHRWRNLLAARTVLSLHRAGMSPAAPTRLGESLITRQLSSPLFGEVAPRELLARLAGARVDVSGARRKDAAHQGAAQSPPPRASHDEPPHAHRAARDDTTRDDSAAPPAKSRGLEIESAQTGSSAKASGLPGEAAAPAPAGSLPPLLPPPLVGMPVLPIALAAAREGARVEAQEAEEDLDKLAAKIKFILDEQARRHGIDV